MYYRPFRLFKLFAIIICVIIIVYEFYRLLIRPKKDSSVIENEDSPLIPLQPKEDFEEISHNLEPFYISLPHFSDDEARNWFYGSSYYKINSKLCPNGSCEEKGILFNDTKEHLAVRIALVKNGLYLNDDCGYNYGDQAVQRTFQKPDDATDIYDKAILYPVPDGWSFQHFLDGVGPKLSHSRSYLTKYPDAKVIILRGARFDRSVEEIWAMLGITDRLVHYTTNMKIGARLLINPCRTPGIHPRLWQDARLMYWSISGLPNPSKKSMRNNFIYIQRTATNAMNGARLILNEEPFIEILRNYCTKHSLNYVQYDHSKDKDHIRSRIELFYNAKLIIGVHSGALSNMNFAQSGTTVIEIMPYRSDSSSLPMTCSMFRVEDLKACAGYILYTQAQLLNQSYWILPSVVDAEGNMNLDINRVKKLFDQV